MRVLYLLLIAVLAILAACAPAGAPTPSPNNQSAPPREPAAARSLSIVMRAEPNDVLTGFVDRSAIHKPLFTALLAGWDADERPYPILGEEVPELNTATWRVLADGRMETTHRLRAGLTWHDGAPLTADDFAFTYRVEVARVESGTSAPSAELRLVDSVEAPDPRTVVFRWSQPYTEALAPELIALPRHVFEPLYGQMPPDAFFNHPAWSSDWVGAGPYRVERWERGAFIQGTAFGGFALGGPQIGRVRLTWSNDPNVTLTRLLSGDADIALDGAIRYEQARVLRDQHGTASTIWLNPTSLRYVQFQARPDYASPRAILDTRVHKAVYHAIDRASLAEAMVEDRSMVADTIPPPGMTYSAAIDRAITKYPFDLARTEQLLAEAGFTRGAEGVYAGPEGRLRIEVRGVSGGQEEQDTTIVDGSLRTAGLDTIMMLLPTSTRQVDEKMKSTFPSITLNNNTLQRGLGLDKWHTLRIGSPENDWNGTNRMGWSNPEYDRLYDAWRTSLDRAEAARRMVEMMKLLSEEVPSLPLYYNFQVVAHTAALVGPQPITPDSTRYGNVHQWSWPSQGAPRGAGLWYTLPSGDGFGSLLG